MPGLKTSEIRGAYIGLRTKFHAIVDSARLKVTGAYGGMGFHVDAVNGAARVQARLYMQNWPWRANSSKRNLDILVRVDEIFSADSPKIMSSSARVAYLSRNGSDATSLLQIHYDFANPVQQAHPVFHAQLGEINWTTSELTELGFTRQIKKGGLSRFHNHHIPTALMGYGPILLALAADHLDYAHYSAFLLEMRKNVSASWGANCEPLRNSLAKRGGYLHSHHWY